jgi:cytoskeletal protein CcmA (bactofilin family)
MKIYFLFALCLLFSLFCRTQQATAAEIKTGETVTIAPTKENLHDLYLFGGSIRVDSPVTNDLVVSGGNITLNSPVTGSILAAGGDLNIKGDVANTVRVAGGNITIDGKIARDLVITGGSITVTKNASIGGDLVFLGGHLLLQGPVQGKILARGGDITIDSAVGQNVEAQVKKITLGPAAQIAGNLVYASPEKALKQDGARVHGTTTFHYLPKEKPVAPYVFTFGAIYKLLTDIILSILFILFLGKFAEKILPRMEKTPLKSGTFGFAYLILFPIVSALFFLLMWLGLAAVLLYMITGLVALFLLKIFLGWILLRWYENRNKKQYHLDWRAGVVGPITLFLIVLVPILGWFVAAILFLIALGALMQELTAIAITQKIDNKGGKKNKNL